MGNGGIRASALVVELDGKGMLLVRFLDKTSAKLSRTLPPNSLTVICW